MGILLRQWALGSIYRKTSQREYPESRYKHGQFLLTLKFDERRLPDPPPQLAVLVGDQQYLLSSRIHFDSFQTSIPHKTLTIVIPNVLHDLTQLIILNKGDQSIGLSYRFLSNYFELSIKNHNNRCTLSRIVDVLLAILKIYSEYQPKSSTIYIEAANGQIVGSGYTKATAYSTETNSTTTDSVETA